MELSKQVSAKQFGESHAKPLCFHCLEPVPPFCTISATIDGQDQAMCCYGCKAAAEFIDGKNLDEFYRHRARRGMTGFFGKVARQVQWTKSDDQWDFLDDFAQASDYIVVDSDDNRRLELLVTGLYCSSCSWLLDKSLKQLSQAIQVHVQLDSNRVSLVISKDCSDLKISQILKDIDKLGYRPMPLSKQQLSRGFDDLKLSENRQLIKRILVAGFAMMQLMSYAIALYLGEFQGIDSSIHRFLSLLSMLVATLAVFYSGKPFFVNAFNDLRNQHFGMDVPIAFAVAGAYFPSVYDTLFYNAEHVYFDSAVMFIFFLSIGRYVEMRARHKLVDSPNALQRVLPIRIEVRRPAGKRLTKLFISPQAVQIGDQAELNQADIVPFDAELICGTALVDESLLSGEVRPIEKRKGGLLMAGSRVINGNISIAARRRWDDSSIVKIEALLKQGIKSEQASGSNADYVSRVFVMAVLLVTTLVALIWSIYSPDRVFEIALAMLIASCPCAFALAGPLSTAAVSKALRLNGVLLVNESALTTILKVSAWFFDKTGTLTKGQTRLSAVQLYRGSPKHQQGSSMHEAELDAVRIAAALEANSDHAMAMAFRDVDTPYKAIEVTELPSQGIIGTINNSEYLLGKPSWILSQLEFDQCPQKITKNQDIETGSAQSELLLATRKGLVARFLLSDEPRCGGRRLLSFLSPKSSQLTILSGDSTASVQRFASTLSTDQAIGDLLPDQKIDQIKKLTLSGTKVAMVGDGLNDAPVMAHADLSIALGSGSELTQTQADLILLNPNLDKIVCFYKLAQLSQRIKQQNMVWATAYNLIVLPLAALGFLSPWLAALGMSISSLLVVLNTFRIRSDRRGEVQ